MKILTIVATLLLSSTSAFADCPNLAGNYSLTDDTDTTSLTTTQTSCASLEFVYSFGPGSDTIGKVYITDGIRKMTSNTPTQIVYETVKWNGLALENLVEFYDVVKKTTITAVSDFYLDSSGNLMGTNKYYDTNGKQYYNGVNTFIRDTAP